MPSMNIPDCYRCFGLPGGGLCRECYTKKKEDHYKNVESKKWYTKEYDRYKEMDYNKLVTGMSAQAREPSATEEDHKFNVTECTIPNCSKCYGDEKKTTSSKSDTLRQMYNSIADKNSAFATGRRPSSPYEMPAGFYATQKTRTIAAAMPDYYHQSSTTNAVTINTPKTTRAIELELRDALLVERQKVIDLTKAITELSEHCSEEIVFIEDDISNTSAYAMISSIQHFQEMIQEMKEMVEHCHAALEENT